MICKLPGCTKKLKNNIFEFCCVEHRMKFKYDYIPYNQCEYIEKIYTDQLINHMLNNDVIFYIKNTLTLMLTIKKNMLNDVSDEEIKTKLNNFVEKDYSSLSYYNNWGKVILNIDGIVHIFGSLERAMYYGKYVHIKDISENIKYSKNFREIGKSNINNIYHKWNNGGDIQWSFIVNLASFMQSEEKKMLLISTGERTIIEASPFDAYWGGFDIMYNGKIIKGENHTGKILMKIREIIMNNTIEKINKIIETEIKDYIS